MASIAQRDNGTWQAKIRQRGYPTQSGTFRTKAEAQQWSRVIESEMARSVFIPRAEAEATTLHDALIRYMSEITPRKKGSVQEVVRVKQLLRNHLANRPLASLQGKDFAQYRDDRLKSVAPSTVVKELAIFSHLFSVCNKDWGIAITNPIQNISKPAINNARNRRLVGDEESRLMNELGVSRNIWLRPLSEFAIQTAMRQGELLSLTWENVKLDHAHLPDTKNGSSRDVPLTNRAREILRSLPRSIEGKVFATTQSAVSQAWVRACDRAQIPDIHFHDLRHEATSRLAEKLQLHELMKVTGHKDPKMLARYFHPRIEDLAKKIA